MTDEELAAALRDSLVRHQSRGVVYGDHSSSETVVHGRFDLLAAASDLRRAMSSRDARRSWAGWFTMSVHRRRSERTLQEQARELAAVPAAARERLRRRAEGAD